MPLQRLYVIVDADFSRGKGMSLPSYAEELRKAGVKLIQYRDKSASPQEILRNAAVIGDVFAGDDWTLIMNDRADLAMLAGWDGVHVGQGDLSPEGAKALLGARGSPHLRSEMSGTQIAVSSIVGVSTHTEAQVAAAERGEADYVAIGPVFATGTKLDAAAVVGLEGVRRARALTRKPLVAIGGITRQNARSVIDAGADSVVVISGLFVPGETVQKVARDFLELLR